MQIPGAPFHLLIQLKLNWAPVNLDAGGQQAALPGALLWTNAEPSEGSKHYRWTASDVLASGELMRHRPHRWESGESKEDRDAASRCAACMEGADSRAPRELGGAQRW